MSEYKDYGYQNSDFSHAHAYLKDAILGQLNKPQNKLILDVGCGNGAIANYLISKGYDVYGIDASESGIEIANTVNPGRFFIHDVSSDKVPQAIVTMKFDTIISTEVVEHLYDPRKYVSFCKAILSKNGGGEVIVSTPYHGYLKNLLLAITGKLDNHFTALWDGGHIKFWSKKTLRVLFEEQGFSYVSFTGAGRMYLIWKSMVLKFRI